jgi:hypothetical protein
MHDGLTPRFQVGGTLREGALYVPRPADDELPAALLRGELCYVLAPRQIGKSSLRVRTRRILSRGGVRCASIDLTQIGGQDVSSVEWYYDLCHHIARQLGLPDPRAFWEEHGRRSPLSRWCAYLREEVLADGGGQVVVFLDEIDAILAQRSVSQDDFFAAVRALYNARADDPAYERLTFCLFGVALPGDLIRDETRTPFNIGRGIALHDFQRAEMDAFLPGLRPVPGDPRRLLDEIYAFTCGHPYMTQKLCEALLDKEEGPAGDEAARVRALVGRLFFRRGRVLEANLANAEKHFTRESSSPRTAPMLRLYGRLRAGERVPALPQDPIQVALRLTGMAAERPEGGALLLKVRNPIFAAVFDEDWVRERMAERLLSEPLSRWLASGRRDELLLRGEPLRQAADWLRDREDAAPDEVAFVMAGLLLARREERARALAHLRRSAAVLLLLLLAVLSGAVISTLRERRERARAESLTGVVREKAAAERALREAAARAEKARLLALLAQEESEEKRRLAEEKTRHAEEKMRRAEEDRARAEEDRARAERARLLAEAESQRAREESRRAAAESRRAAEEKARAEASKRLTEEARRRLESGLGVVVLPSAFSGVLGHGDLVHHASFSPDGASVVTASQDQRARIWHYASGRTLHLRGHPEPVRDAAFSPDSRRVVTASWDRTARIWDAESGEPRVSLVGHPGPVLMARFSADGRRVLTASSDLSARVWDADTGRLLHRLPHPGPVYAAAFSIDGGRIITGAWDGMARIWDAEQGQVLLLLHGHTGPLRAAELSPDGGRALTAGDDGTARVWDGQSGRPLFVLRGHRGPLHGAAFSPDGRRVVTASADWTARVWDAATGRLLAPLPGHTAGVHLAAFSPDGARVVTASADWTARVWDAATGRVLLHLIGHRGEVYYAAFSPDGDQVVTASRDRTARLFPGSIKAWLEAACDPRTLAEGLPPPEGCPR